MDYLTPEEIASQIVVIMRLEDREFSRNELMDRLSGPFSYTDFLTAMHSLITKKAFSCIKIERGTVLYRL